MSGFEIGVIVLLCIIAVQNMFHINIKINR